MVQSGLSAHGKTKSPADPSARKDQSCAKIHTKWVSEIGVSSHSARLEFAKKKSVQVFLPCLQFVGVSCCLLTHCVDSSFRGGDTNHFSFVVGEFCNFLDSYRHKGL